VYGFLLGHTPEARSVVFDLFLKQGLIFGHAMAMSVQLKIHSIARQLCNFLRAHELENSFLQKSGVIDVEKIC